jgi:uncharacterized membrane protein
MDNLNQSLLNSTTAGGLNTPAEVYKAFATYINDRVFSFLIGAAITVTVVFVLYGSFQYFTAYGDENKATSAKKTITYAFLGLFISFLAMGIASYVQKSITAQTAPASSVNLPARVN